MVRPRRPPSQSWRTFLANHVEQIRARISSWCRRRPAACCSFSSSSLTIGGGSCTSRSPRTRPPPDGAATPRSVPVERYTALLDPRSGSRVRGRRCDHRGDGHHRSADGPAITLAKRAHRTLHRIRATGVPRSRDRLPRCWLTARLETVRRVLRTIAHPFGARQGRAGVAGCLAVDGWEHHRRSAGRRLASSIRAARGLNERLWRHGLAFREQRIDCQSVSLRHHTNRCRPSNEDGGIRETPSCHSTPEMRIRERIEFLVGTADCSHSTRLTLQRPHLLKWPPRWRGWCVSSSKAEVVVARFASPTIQPPSMWFHDRVPFSTHRSR